MPYPTLPPGLDPQVTSSLLQKAIRRGETELAASAARLYNQQRGHAVWLRLLTIAFEDVGIGDPDLVVEAATYSLGRKVRKVWGEDDQLAGAFADRLAKAPKDRSADHLYCAAVRHPDWKIAREVLEDGPMETAMEIALDPDQVLMHRAIAALRVCGPLDQPSRHLPLLLSGLEQQGAPSDLMTATEIAARRLQHPFVVMTALAAAVRAADGGEAVVQEVDLPPYPDLQGAPLYAWDKHTHMGRKAIRRLVGAQTSLRHQLLKHLPPRAVIPVTGMAVFHTESALTSRPLVWSHTKALEAAGCQADLMKAGAGASAVGPVLTLINQNLPALNQIRAGLLTPSGYPAS